MNFLLKIVEGPNRGAEIALPEGVAITLGKGDDCDIVLADPTLPDAPLSIEATTGGVMAGGEPLAPFAVRTSGATSFAVGPADAPWDELKWPERESPADSAAPASATSPSDVPGPASSSSASSPASASSPSSSDGPSQPVGRRARRRSRLPGIVAAVVLLVVLLLLFARCSNPRPSTSDLPPSDLQLSTPLSALMARYGLSSTNLDGKTVLSGDFATRAERLIATAEAYEACPGIELDFSDAVSLKTAIEDTFAMLDGAAALKVADITNRVAVITGNLASPADLTRILGAIAADVPKLRDVDVAEVELDGAGLAGLETTDERRGDGASRVSRPASKAEAPALPVCGILTAPYPCLVLRSGARVMDGAPLGEWTVARIEADSVTLTNAERSVTWNP